MLSQVGATLLGIAVVVLAWQSYRRAWWRPAISWKRPRVLMYHMIREHRPGARFNKLRVPPKRFEQQVEWLSRRGFTFHFASDLFREDALPERSVCLTFDDGYEDNLSAADPILEKFGAKATLYLVEDRSGGWSSKKKSHHADDELASERKLTDAQVCQLLRSGRWELGGHTVTHANLSALAHDEREHEISRARTSFPERFGCEAPTFAYPFGIYSDDDATIVHRAGYAGAVTTDPGIPEWPLVDPMRVRRIKISGRDLLVDFILRVRGGKRGFKK